MTRALDDEPKELQAEDRQWTGPRFLRLGAVTLAIALALIYAWSAKNGCSLVVVP